MYNLHNIIYNLLQTKWCNDINCNQNHQPWPGNMRASQCITALNALWTHESNVDRHRVWQKFWGFPPGTKQQSVYAGLYDLARIRIRSSLTHAKTCNAGWCFRHHKVSHGVSRLFDSLSERTCFHLWSQQGIRGGYCQFLHSLAYASQAARWWAVSTGPTKGLQSFIPVSRSLFLTVWSEICTMSPLEVIL